MFKSLDIQDHMEGANRILLTKDDPVAGGRHHLIAIDWVDYVDSKVHLNKSCGSAMKEWKTAA
jgi:hypothetical protein